MADEGEFDTGRSVRRVILVRRVTALINLMALSGLLVWTTVNDRQLRSPMGMSNVVAFAIVAAIGVGTYYLGKAALKPLVDRELVDGEWDDLSWGRRTFMVAFVVAAAVHMAVWLYDTNHAPSVATPVRITECHEGEIDPNTFQHRGVACSGAWTVHGVHYSGTLPHDDANEGAYYAGQRRTLKVSTEHPNVVVSNAEDSFLYWAPFLCGFVLIWVGATWVFKAFRVSADLRTIPTRIRVKAAPVDDQPDEYFAMLDEQHPRSNPRGLLRRRHGDPPVDEALGEDLEWRPTENLQQHNVEQVQISEPEARHIINRWKTVAEPG